MLATLLSGCSLSRNEELDTLLTVYGPLRGYVEGDGKRVGYALDAPEYVDATDDNLRHINIDTQSEAGIPNYSLGLREPGEYKGTFVVADSGPILVRIATGRPSTGMLDSDAGPVPLALFFIEAPVGATITIRFTTGQDSDDLRVQIDRDSDGRVDDELEPVGTDEGDYPSHFPPTAGSSITALPDGWVQATLTKHPASGQSTDDIQLYYALYPQAPGGQLYDGPFIVDGPSHLIFGAFDVNGQISRLHEERLLGGLAKDLEFELPGDGALVEIDFTVPGQQAILTYPAELGDEVELEFLESTVGILPDAGLGYGDGVGRDGGLYYIKHRHNSDNQISLDPEWGYTGKVVLRLTNVYEHATEMTIDGPPVSFDVHPAGHRRYARIESDENEILLLRVVATDIAETDYASDSMRLAIFGENGERLTDWVYFEEPGEVVELDAERSVSYFVELQGNDGTTGSVEIEVVAKVTGSGP
jgi:hypothetical protein